MDFQNIIFTIYMLIRLGEIKLGYVRLFYKFIVT